MFMRWTLDDLRNIVNDALQDCEEERRLLLDALNHAKNEGVGTNWQLLVQIAKILITEPLSQAIPDILKLLNINPTPPKAA